MANEFDKHETIRFKGVRIECTLVSPPQYSATTNLKSVIPYNVFDFEIKSIYEIKKKRETTQLRLKKLVYFSLVKQVKVN